MCVLNPLTSISIILFFFLFFFFFYIRTLLHGSIYVTYLPYLEHLQQKDRNRSREKRERGDRGVICLIFLAFFHSFATRHRHDSFIRPLCCFVVAAERLFAGKDTHTHTHAHASEFTLLHFVICAFSRSHLLLLLLLKITCLHY